MLTKTEFGEPIKSHQDMVDRDISLRRFGYNMDQILSQSIPVLWPDYLALADEMKYSNYEPYRILGIIRITSWRLLDDKLMLRSDCNS